ncbi:MAG: M3 family oligoendopeptidase [Christensenellales bacterium]
MNWDLTKLYTSFRDARFLEDCKTVSEKLDALLADAGAFDETSGHLKRLLRAFSDATELLSKTFLFAQLSVAANADDEEAKAACDRLFPEENKLKRAASAFARKLGEIRDLDALIGEDEYLLQHRAFLMECRERAAHSIAPELEPWILEMQLTGGTAWSQLRDQLDATLMVDVNGEKMPLSAARNFAYSADAKTRKDAYKAELAAYPKVMQPMAACLNGIKGEALTLIKLQHYESVLEKTLAESRMSRKTLDALLAALRDSFPMFRRYFRLKAKMLGYDGGLKFCDLFAPVGKIDAKYSPEEAKALLIRELGAFSPKMGQMIERAFSERWIDMYPREGKSGGAFCAGAYVLGISYILTNFDGSYSAVSTLAHELGHAYHDFCMKDEPILLTQCPMQLAETASTFNETLLAAQILKDCDTDMRIAILEAQLSDGAQVIVDIMSRFLFEYEVFETRKDHALTPKELCAIMEKAQKETYGDGLDPEWLHPFMWACKSHYYSTGLHFYNFPYAFGQLFALGVFAKRGEMGKGFLPMYEELLRASGSGSVEEAALRVGIDITDRAFWDKSMEVYAEKLAMLEECL